MHIYAAFVKEYVFKVFDYYDKDGMTMRRLYRNNCPIEGKHLVKNLRIIVKRSQK